MNEAKLNFKKVKLPDFKGFGKEKRESFKKAYARKILNSFLKEYRKELEENDIVIRGYSVEDDNIFIFLNSDIKPKAMDILLKYKQI